MKATLEKPGMKTFLQELKKRRVYRVVLAYGVVGSALVQVGGTVLPIFHAADWIQQVFVVLVAFGFPIALVLAWDFDVEGGGIKRTHAVGRSHSVANTRRVWILAAVGLLIASFALVGYWFWHPWKTAPRVEFGAGTAIPQKSIAVLPFENLSRDPDNAFFANGIQDEILTIAVTTSPNNAEILSYSAAIYLRQGRWRESLASFERAQNLDPRNADFAIDAAVAHLQVRDWPAAAAGYNRVLEIAPDSVSPKVDLANLEVLRNGNLASAKAILRKIPAGIDPEGTVTLANWDLSMLERDFTTAEKILDRYPLEEFPGVGMRDPKSFYQGRTALARGDVGQAQRLFEKVRPIFEAEVRDHPDGAQRHAALGILYAYLHRKEEAIRESRRAVDLEPESKDALLGPWRANDLALVYARTGEADQAIALIERLLSTPGGITLADLRLRWEWDPLRSDPRFQNILAGPEPKTVYK